MRVRGFRRIIVLASMGLAVGATARAQTRFRLADGFPTIRSARICEASGMAVSRRDPSKLWIVNDSGSPAELHLVGTDGVDFGSITLQGLSNTDWEDLASFTLDGKHWLLVADTGDNDAKRPERTLWLLEEPAIPADAGKPSATCGVSRRIRFRFAGGPRDCESVAVDPSERKILLISKRTDPPEVHDLPLDPPAGQGIPTTRLLTTMRTNAPTAGLIPFRNQPTALDINADRSLAAVLTYYGVFLFRRESGESWSEAFAREPVILPPHMAAQAECLAFSNDGKVLHVLSEGRNPPLIRYVSMAIDGR